MSSSVIQLLVLAGVAIFLILRLKDVLGTRGGFEKRTDPKALDPATDPVSRRGLEVIDGGPDADITDHVPEGSPAAQALAAMKGAEPGFNVTDFLRGARAAYEQILKAFDQGALDEIVPFLSRDVYESFQQVVESRETTGLTIKSNFIGVRELVLSNATFDRATGEAEMVIRFVGELTSTTRNSAGEIVEGSPTEAKRQKDIWTFARRMGADNPNWQLVATGE